MPITQDDARMGQMSGVTADELDARLSLAYIQTLAEMDGDVGRARRALSEGHDSSGATAEQWRDLEELFDLCAASVATARDARDRVHRELLLLYRDLSEVAGAIEVQRQQVHDLLASRRADSSAAALTDATSKVAEDILGLADHLSTRPDIRW